MATKMKRSEIIDEAKQLVLNQGAAKVFEFGEELLTNINYGQWSDEDMDAILQEALKQARRVYDFLGYVPVWK